MSLITDDLFENILVSPVRDGANQLFIVSGYATATMAMRQIEYLQRELKKSISIRLIVGMCPQDGIQLSQHLGFQKLHTGDFEVDFKCSYIVDRPPIHSKVYSWCRDGEPLFGFLGSANYTQNAFSRSIREVLVSSDPNKCLDYYYELLGETRECLDSEIPTLINIYDRKSLQLNGASESRTAFDDKTDFEKVTLTLLEKRNGEVPARSGLNWGQRPEYGRNPNQAYINIPSNIINLGFFPERHKQFMVLTDDEKELICVRAQANGKGIHTSLDNSRMGEYFRFRLGVPSGAFIKKEDLLKYGRTDVDFYKIDDETFYLDFSVH